MTPAVCYRCHPAESEGSHPRHHATHGCKLPNDDVPLLVVRSMRGFAQAVGCSLRLVARLTHTGATVCIQASAERSYVPHVCLINHVHGTTLPRFASTPSLARTWPRPFTLCAPVLPPMYVLQPTGYSTQLPSKETLSSALPALSHAPSSSYCIYKVATTYCTAEP